LPHPLQFKILSLFLFYLFSLLPTLFPPGKGPFRFASIGVGFAITFRLSMGACLKTERLQRGSPAAIAPFAPLGFALMDGVNEFVFT